MNRIRRLLLCAAVAGAFPGAVAQTDAPPGRAELEAATKTLSINGARALAERYVDDAARRHGKGSTAHADAMIEAVRAVPAWRPSLEDAARGARALRKARGAADEGALRLAAIHANKLRQADRIDEALAVYRDAAAQSRRSTPAAPAMLYASIEASLYGFNWNEPPAVAELRRIALDLRIEEIRRTRGAAPARPGAEELAELERLRVRKDRELSDHGHAFIAFAAYLHGRDSVDWARAALEIHLFEERVLGPAILRDVVRILARDLGESAPETLKARFNLSFGLKGDAFVAEQERIAALAGTGTPEGVGQTIRSLGWIAMRREEETRYDLAVEPRRRAFDLAVARTPGDRDLLLNEGYALARTMERAERSEEASRLLARLVALLGQEDFRDGRAARTLILYGETLVSLGRRDEARAMLLKAVAVGERNDGAGYPSKLTYNNAAFALNRAGLFADAEPLARKAVSLLGPDEPDFQLELTRAKYEFNLATALAGQGKPGAAAIYRRALPIQRDWAGDDHPDLLILLSALAYAVAREEPGNRAEAVAFAREAVAIAKRRRLRSATETSQTIPGRTGDAYAAFLFAAFELAGKG